GRRIRDALASGTREYQPTAMLAERIRDAYRAGADQRAALPGVDVLAESAAPDGTGFLAPARLLGVPAHVLRDDAVRTTLFDECSGPLTVVVEYADDAQLGDLLARLPGSLTATVHAGAEETPTAQLDVLRQRAGRIVWNGYPTGVAVTWATQHGGPYPSTTDSRATSVGATAIERGPAPIPYQSTPDPLLQPALPGTN